MARWLVVIGFSRHSVGRTTAYGLIDARSVRRRQHGLAAGDNVEGAKNGSLPPQNRLRKLQFVQQPSKYGGAPACKQNFEK